MKNYLNFPEFSDGGGQEQSGSYTAIAGVYDIFNKEIDYEKWADSIEKCFDRFLDSRPELVLDLACGTGRMTQALAARGYDMIGVDMSAEMLSEARENTPQELGVLYLLQDMREFELYGTVGAVVCCLDSVNYLTDDGDLTKCFACVHNYLDPDGLFLFDVNTPYKFENIYKDNSYIFEDIVDTGNGQRAVFCGWQNYYDRETKLCDFMLSVFTENDDGSYRREEEYQTERCFSLDEICEALETCGFELCGVYGSPEAPEMSTLEINGEETTEDDCDRWFFAAKCKKPGILKPGTVVNSQ